MQEHPLVTVTDLTERLGYGLIFVNDDGTIGEYSEVAKEKFGLVVPKGKSHRAGRVEKGDIVIIADNMIGNDDALTAGELSMLGIDDPDIRPADAIIAIGTYADSKFAPVYKYYSRYYPQSDLRLRETYRDYDIVAGIDLDRKLMYISINGDEYQMAYLESIGFMVIVRPESGEVKFFQDVGYGFRGEEVGRILQGVRYSGKNCPPEEGEENCDVPIVGLPLRRIALGDEFLSEVQRIMELPDGATSEGDFEIYRRLVFCKLVRIRKGSGSDGVLILIQDKDNVENSLTAGRAYIADLEKRSKAAQLRLDANREEHFEKFLGSSPRMQTVKHLAYKASKSKFNVIILGESGTGKSRLAREIHNTQDPDAPFVEVACNAITPSLFESELFGYAPGSFTGADKNGRRGYFEEADGGTIFLDEIGEIPPEIQAKLLYVIQNKLLYRVGSPKPVPVDVRVITATSRDLEDEIKNGNFRQDLYYRINVFPIELPPLRERKQDIAGMAESILSDFCARYEIEPKRFSDEALKIITFHDWPGNVRELENVIERAITVCEGTTIYADHLVIGRPKSGKQTLKNQLAQEEARIIANTLIINSGDKQKTMEELGMSRSVFYKKLKEYELI